ncbi:MAG: HAD family phosphatase [Candidatus Omnitrophica bacterium]|nr:HAD family phosphatase [Candidatus Omnitrophota bacterium]MDD5237970.1 HAD family phosphatase [Candidatus Omnitrophota bacterium]
MEEDNHPGIKAIIFDLGNVLIDFDHMIAAQRLSKLTDKTGKEIFDLFFNSELTGLFEEGKISPLDFFLKVKETLNLKMGFAEFVPIWNEIFFCTKKNLDVYNLACNLKKTYKLALLSNINTLHFEYIKKTFPLLDAFHNVIASFQLGLRKPQRRIYQKTLNILHVLPEEVFYVDDREELVESAKELKIRAHVFTGLEKLKKDLLDAGINC